VEANLVNPKELGVYTQSCSGTKHSKNSQAAIRSEKEHQISPYLLLSDEKIYCRPQQRSFENPKVNYMYIKILLFAVKVSKGSKTPLTPKSFLISIPNLKSHVFAKKYYSLTCKEKSK